MSLAVSRYIERPSKTEFPFGKAILEPVVIAIKGSVILLVVSYSLYSAVQAMFFWRATSRRLYCNTLWCGQRHRLWLRLVVHRKQIKAFFSSGLIEAEATQWQMDTLLSVAVTLGFIAAWLVSISPYAEYAVYADPMMMILMSFYFIKVPFDMLKEAMRELLMMKPSDEIVTAVDQEVSALDKQVSQQLQVAGVTKVGRELRVNLEVHAKGTQVHVAELEKTRRILKRQVIQTVARPEFDHEYCQLMKKPPKAAFLLLDRKCPLHRHKMVLALHNLVAQILIQGNGARIADKTRQG
ncbi:cation transporter [Vibrio sinaloensis]|nr:cation transporter [Vibrio sinaloensis]